MAQNRRLRAMGRPKLPKKKVNTPNLGPAKIDLEPNPAFKEGGMVGRATGQGYGAARKGGNLV